MPYDAVTLVPGGRWLKAELRDSLPPLRWTRRSASNTAVGELGCSRYDEYRYRKDEVIVRARDGEVYFVRTNLARLFRGGHGGVLSSQNDVDQAFLSLEAILNEISFCPGMSFWKPTRLELGWNFALCFQELESLALTACTSWVRKGRSHILGEKVSIRGAEFEFKIYNKALIMYRAHEIGDPNLPISRIEVVLQGKKLREVIGAESFVPQAFLSFANAQSWIRQAIESFHNPKPILVTKADSVRKRLILAALYFEKLGQDMNGMSPTEFCLNGFSKKTQRNCRKEFHAVVVELAKKTLSDYFPPGEWAPVESGDLLLPKRKIL